MNYQILVSLLLGMVLGSCITLLGITTAISGILKIYEKYVFSPEEEE